VSKEPDHLVLLGEVSGIPGHGFYKVTAEGHEMLATLCGKMRQHHISIQPGDVVTVHVSPADLSRAVISYRHLAPR
jgi:translation initiation factor IF-1